MRYFLPAIFLSGLLLLTACYTRRTSPRESFLLQGHVRDCSTGAPLAGAEVSIMANDPNTGILSTGNNNAGSAITDGQGRFSVTPYFYEETIRFNFSIIHPGYREMELGINKADILASGEAVYMLDSACLQP